MKGQKRPIDPPPRHAGISSVGEKVEEGKV